MEQRKIVSNDHKLGKGHSGYIMITSAYEYLSQVFHCDSLILCRERETSRFRVDVSVAEQDEVIFYLTYEVSKRHQSTEIFFLFLW